MYSIKIYTLLGAWKKTISLNELKSDFKFTANYNGGMGQCVLDLSTDFHDTSIANGDFARIYKGTQLLYTGKVEKIQRYFEKGNQGIMIPLLGLGVITKYTMFFSTGIGYTFTKNQDPAQTVKDIIDWMNTRYPTWFSYDASSIPDYGSNEGFSFDYTTCFNALNIVAERIGWKWFIDRDGKMHFKPKPTTSTHDFVIGRHIEAVYSDDTIEQVFNNLRVEHSSGVNIYLDSASQTEYGNRVKYFNKSSNSSAQADTFGNAYIAQSKDEKQQVKVIVNDSYDIDSIKILDNITIKNFGTVIQNLQILKYTYSVDKIVLELEKIDSFGQEVKS